MGGVADAVSGALGTDGGGGGLLGAVESVTAPVIKSVGSIADGAVHAVGSAAESVGHTLQAIGQGAVNNPIGTIAKVAAVASGQWWALPLVSAIDVVAHGGNIEQAALSAGVSLAASYIGGQISSSLTAPAADSMASVASQEAVQMAAQNASTESISATLQSVYGINPTIAASMAGAAGNGISSSVIASSFGGAFGSTLNGVADAFSEKLLATAVGNSAANFAKTLVQTKGDVGKALQMGAAAGIGTQFSGMISNQLIQAGADSTIANITGKIAGATTSGVVQGQEVGQALGTSLVSNIVSISYAQAGNALKSAADQAGITKIFTEMGTAAAGKMNEFASMFKSEQAKAADLATQQSTVVNDYNAKLGVASAYYKDTLTPAQEQAQKLQDVATSSFNAYKSQADQYSSLVSQYDAAKAAGNADLANSLADQANAMIPTLNGAADKYNADVNTYQTASQTFNDIAANYKAQTNALEPLKEQYTNLGNKITETTASCNKYADLFNTTASTVQQDVQAVIDKKIEADEQFADAPAAVKKSFENAFSTGMMPDKAAEVANNVAKLTDVAKDSFNQSFATGESVDSALKFAQKVSALPTKDQNYYDFASGLGLKPADALAVAPQLASSSTPALQSFFDTYSGTGSTTAAAKVAADINGLTTQQQTAFVNGRSNGLDIGQSLAMANSVGTLSAKQQDEYLAAIRGGLNDTYASMYAKSAGIYTTDKTAVADINSQNLSQLQNQEAKDAYAMSMAKSGAAADPTAALNAAKQLDQEISTNKSIYISGVGQNTGNVTVESAGLATTPEEKSFFQKYGALLSFGTPDAAAGKSSIFGTGATGGNANDPFALVAFDTQAKKDATIVDLTNFLQDPTKTAEEKQVAQQLKAKLTEQPVTPPKTTAPTQAGQTGQSGTGTSTPTTAKIPTTADQSLQNYIDQLVKPATGGSTTTGGSTSSTPTAGSTTGGTTVGGGTTAGGSTTTGVTAGGSTTAGTTTGTTSGGATTGGGTTTTGGAPVTDTATGTQPSQSDIATAYANAALQKAIASGDKSIVDAVNSGNGSVIAALNAGNTSLAASIAAGAGQTTNAIGQLGTDLSSQLGNLSGQVAGGAASTNQAITDSTKALQFALTTGDQRIVDAVKSGNTDVIGALNSGNTSLASQIAAGTQATKEGTAATTQAISDSTKALQFALTTGDQRIVDAVNSGNTDVISALNSGNTNLAKTIADTSAATQAGISGLGTQIGTGLGTLGTQMGAGFGTIGSAIAAQSAAQAAAAKAAATASAASGLQAKNQAAVNYMQQGTDATGGIKNLSPGLTQASQDYSLAGIPTIQEAMNPTFQVPQFASGGSTDTYDPFVTGSSGDSVSAGISGALKPGLTKAQIAYILSGLPGNLVEHKAEGGEVEGHNPTFFSPGGLASIDNTYVKGEGDGTSDSVAAMLANGEFVIPADIVSNLGNGSNEAGASVLDQFLKSIREHKQANGTKLPPDSKGPLAYLIDAKRKVKA